MENALTSEVLYLLSSVSTSPPLPGVPTAADHDLVAPGGDPARAIVAPTRYEQSAVRKAAIAASTASWTRSVTLCAQLTAAAANPPVQGPTTYVPARAGNDRVPSL